MANAGININGNGTIHDITSMNGRVEDVMVSRMQQGVYEVHGTLGMVPPPYGWGHVTNPLDRISAQITVTDSIVHVQTRNEAGDLVDIPSMLSLHIVIPDRDVGDTLPITPQPQLEPDAVAKYAQLRAVADEQILMLQDLIDIGESTPQIQLRLVEWKRYRVRLNQLAHSVPGQGDIQWPVQPE